MGKKRQWATGVGAFSTCHDAATATGRDLPADRRAVADRGARCTGGARRRDGRQRPTTDPPDRECTRKPVCWPGRSSHSFRRDDTTSTRAAANATATRATVTRSARPVAAAKLPWPPASRLKNTEPMRAIPAAVPIR